MPHSNRTGNIENCFLLKYHRIINIAIIYIELQIQFDNVIRTSNQVNP